MKHAIVIGLGFGDEGKGTTVDYLTRKLNAKTVVRFNGGAQAAHNVVLPDGRHHTFAQFGAGTLAGDDVLTYLSEYHLFDPLALEEEEKALAAVGVPDAVMTRLWVARKAVVVTTFHVLANRIIAFALNHSHGSCGMGIWETQRDHNEVLAESLKAEDLYRPLHARTKLKDTQTRMVNRCREYFAAARKHGGQTADNYIERLTSQRESDRWYDRFGSNIMAKLKIADREFLETRMIQAPVIFEGAQGVLLDEEIGFHPYVSGTDTTAGNAEYLIRNAGAGEARKVGVIRAYTTRHGPGPMVTEDITASIAGDYESDHGHDVRFAEIREAHNNTGIWQGRMRYGPLDFVMLNYALENQKVDELMVTCLDNLVHDQTPFCDAYDVKESGGYNIHRIPQHHGSVLTTLGIMACKPVISYCPTHEFTKVISNNLYVPVRYISRGPSYADKEEISAPSSNPSPVTQR